MKSLGEPTSTRPAESLTVELYVRSLSPGGFLEQQRGVVERLERLEANGTISDYGVDVWGRGLAEPDTARTSAGRWIHDRIGEFREWAEREGMCLDSFFPVEAARSEITGEEYTYIRFPAMALAEYEGDDLRFVSPCSDGESVHTVMDRVDELASVVDATETRAREVVVDEE